MSRESVKGRTAETAVVELLAALGDPVYRPRTTSSSNVDTGDVHGLPLVVSVKNHRRIDLSSFVDEMVGMVGRSRFDAGVVIVKRPGKGNPRDWYAVTTGDMLLRLLYAYLEWCHRVDTST